MTGEEQVKISPSEGRHESKQFSGFGPDLLSLWKSPSQPFNSICFNLQDVGDK